MQEIVKVAFCGTRGIPAAYGGFETAVNEISLRMASQGIDCSVFCRSQEHGKQTSYLDNRRLVYIKGSKNRKLDTFVSSIRTGIYLIKNRKDFDYVFWFNNANVLGIMLTLISRIPMAVNTDGLEWRRAKWSWPFKLFYFLSSLIISIFCNNLISDSISIQQYYKKVFFKKTNFIPYGSPIVPQVSDEYKAQVLSKYALQEDKFFLQITRFEPDNLPLDIIKGFIDSNLFQQGYKFVLIGFKDETPYSIQIKALDQVNGVHVLKANYDANELAVLRLSTSCYVHGNSVGGTNPALLEAMACCKRILAIDSPFSKEVLGENGILFSVEKLSLYLQKSLNTVSQLSVTRNRLNNYYRWDAVANSYQELVLTKKANYLKQINQTSKVDMTF